MAPKDGAVEGHDRIREQLDHILSSPAFLVPDRGRRFLRYVVEETLEGRSEQLDVYTIATAVFGRGVEFDAQSDPVVRIEAGRVRRALERYYLVRGGDDPVIITIPKGHYAPRFEEAGHGAEVAESSDDIDGKHARQEAGKFAYRDLLVPLGVPAVFAALAMLALIRPLEHYLSPSPVQPITSETLQARIVVEQFALLGQMPGGPNIARGLSDQLISELSKVNGLVVIEPKLSANSPAAASMFALQGSISRENNTIHVQARLMATDDGRVVWAKRFDSQTDGRDILDLQALICAQIVNDISLTRQIRSSLLTN